jgi:hypothetical protein
VPEILLCTRMNACICQRQIYRMVHGASSG